MPSTVYFAGIAADKLEENATLPAKFQRLLARFPLPEMLSGKTVAIKMHLGREMGYTTIHPFFTRLLVKAVKEAGGRPFIADLNDDVASAKDRGYTEETVGAPLIGTTGLHDRYHYPHPVSLGALREVQVAGYIEDAEVLINFAHVKGHGCCGYGGSCKNLAMGCVTQKTRGDLHAVEGGLHWDDGKCLHCGKCVEACRHEANCFTGEGRYKIDYHNCVYCRHCVTACPQGAIRVTDEEFSTFQNSMALATKTVLDTFAPGNVLHLNMLTNITILCDCWGFSTPSLVPDLGIAASVDLVALEQASLDQIKEENLIPGSLPKGRELVPGKHLFERIHAKDPFIQVAALERHGLGSRAYELIEVL